MSAVDISKCATKGMIFPPASWTTYPLFRDIIENNIISFVIGTSIVECLMDQRYNRILRYPTDREETESSR